MPEVSGSNNIQTSTFDIGSLRQEAAKLHPENETENRLGTRQADI